ncbi:hypothetical protein PAXRUDRAFT_18385 [Paxillus rubicundulus Ve08.2h10]|uniref:Uncharacterized protein n=1 Tax=Paxillus rubicundulus Ve08.2h10 TaxID=930991 RepID=A0A0D0DEY8_9AGAM|nr:hypothetical protein PAXRUDRAFT_18385 [Paxillus rubicundulus Ve08.2h10]
MANDSGQSNQCALNFNGTLKDVSEIAFYDSEGNDQPITTHAIKTTSQASRASRAPKDDNAASTSTGGRKWKRAQEASNNNVAPNTKHAKTIDAACHARSNIVLSDNKDDSSHQSGQETSPWSELPNDGFSDDKANEEDGTEPEDYAVIQAERELDNKVRHVHLFFSVVLLTFRV